MTWDQTRSERFLREVPLERARLAIEDPDGENGAVAPLSAVKARQMLLEAGEPPVRPVDRSVALASISTDAPADMLIDRLDPLGHTILYGTGGVGKGALACWWIVQLVRTGHRVLILDYEKHPEEWSRRIASLDNVSHSGEAIRHLAPSEPIRKAAAEIAWTCDANELDVVVVDSAVMACGADPLKPEAAADYAAAVLDIGRPTLSLAHVTKVDDARYPFGSVFWHNLARATWSLVVDQTGTVILSHKKHNNYLSLGRFAMTATWDESGQLREVWEKGYGTALRERLMEVLTDGPLTLSEILEVLNDADENGPPVKRETVRRTLSRYMPETFRLSGLKYEVPS